MVFVLAQIVGGLARSRIARGNETDAELVKAAQSDPRQFGPIYERYHDRIYRYCYTRLGSREAAEDATADVFLKALTNLRQFRPDTVFPAWLYTIARHAVADYYQKRRPTAAWDEDLPLHTGQASEGHAARQIDRTALAIAMAELADEQRAVMDLQLAGWSGAEIAATLGKSEAAVKMIRYRAMGHLQQLLRQDQ